MVGDNVVVFLRETVTSCTPPVAIMALAGVVYGFARRRPWGPTPWLALTTGPAACVLLTLSLQPHQLREFGVWLIPFFVVLALYVGRFMADSYDSPSLAVRVGAYIVTVVAIVGAVGNGMRADSRDYYVARELGCNLLRSIGYEGKTIIAGRGVGGVLETLYLQKEEAARPDATFLDLSGMIYYESAPAVPGEEAAYELETIAAGARRGRPVYYTAPQPRLRRYGYGQRPAGMLFLTTPAPAGVTAVPWERLALTSVATWEKEGAPAKRADVPARETASLYHIMKAREAAAAGDRVTARDELKAAAAIADDLSDPLAEVAGILFSVGEYEEAALVFGRAAAVFPRAGRHDPKFRGFYGSIRADEGLAWLMAGDIDAAAAAYRAARDADPGRTDWEWTRDRAALERAARELAARRR